MLLSTTNTPAKHTRPWKRTDTIVQWSNNVQQTRSPHIPMNPKCHFVSTLCVLHKERKQELCNLSCQRLHDGNEKKQRHRTNVREVHSLAGACTGYQAIEPFKSTLFVSAWLLSCVVISGACPTIAPETQPHITAASSSKKKSKNTENTHQEAGQTRSVRPAFPVLEGQTSYKGPINRTMWNSAQPLSLSAKIFLHHRQRLCFAFAHSQCHKQKQH